jgi:signal peptide peptidase SppA
VIGLRGILAHRIEQVQDISGPGGTSMQGFRERFRSAMVNDDIGAIVIDVDSPGGNVDGIQEMATDLREARGQKPIVAVANTAANSAAYWLASQADEVVVSPSAQVGSVGVFVAHQDLSEQMEQDGIRVTLVHAGAHKVEGSPFAPLSEGAREHMQAMVDTAYTSFVADVAAGRGITPKVVEEDFGQGRVFGADQAVRRGMADRVETLEQVITRLRGSTTRPRRRADVPRFPAAFQFWQAPQAHKETTT